MMRPVVVGAAVLLCSLPLPARAADDGWGGGRPRLVTGAVSVGTYLFLVHEASAEVLVADRLGIGARAVYFPGAELQFLPSVTLGSPRSRPSAGYVTLAWVPGSSGKAFAGTLGLGYERAFPNQLRVYGEAGVFAGASDEFALAVPYLLVGVRLRL